MQTKTQILIVDDDPLMREMMRVLFEENNFEVVEAPDVSTGLRIAAERFPQLIIVDVMMPRLSGEDFIVALRADASTRHIPILVCSAKQPPADRECLELGANAYIKKPMQLPNLLDKSLQLLGLRKTTPR